MTYLSRVTLTARISQIKDVVFREGGVFFKVTLTTQLPSGTLWEAHHLVTSKKKIKGKNEERREGCGVFSFYRGGLFFLSLGVCFFIQLFDERNIAVVGGGGGGGGGGVSGNAIILKKNGKPGVFFDSLLLPKKVSLKELIRCFCSVDNRLRTHLGLIGSVLNVVFFFFFKYFCVSIITHQKVGSDH